MSDSSNPQKALDAVKSSRYAGAAQVLGYAEKQAAWLKETEQRERRAERKVTRKKRLRLAGKVTAFLVAFALIIGVIIAAVMGIAHLSQEASKNAQVAASASASATPSAPPSPTPSSTPSPSPTSASPKPSPSPPLVCPTKSLSDIAGAGLDNGGSSSSMSDECAMREHTGMLRGAIQTMIILASLMGILLVCVKGMQYGSVKAMAVPIALILIIGAALNFASQVLI